MMTIRLYFIKIFEILAFDVNQSSEYKLPHIILYQKIPVVFFK